MSSFRTGPSRRRFLAQLGTVVGAGPFSGMTKLHASRSSLDISGPGSLKRHAADARLLFGFAVDAGQLGNNAAYRQLVEEQCSIIVAENAMKWDALAPSPTDYNFEQADALSAFSDRTQIKLRGHTLCWHNQLPNWFGATVTPANARRVLVNHIRTVAGRYAGRMHSWDVVNEAIDPGAGRPDGLRESPWLRLLGTGYIETAFRTAREADPAALLTYNDFGLELDTDDGARRRAAVLVMLRRLKQRNVPIDAVGLQSHLTAGDRFGQGLLSFIEACREMDLQVFLSEIDVNDRNLPGNLDQRDRGVADTYSDYLTAALRPRNVTTVVTWGASDANSWLNWSGETRLDGKPLRPLLFDDKLQPTRAFSAVREAFNNRVQRYSGVRTPAQQQSAPDRPLPKL
jgi:endo-1,4-beta-xylanase